MKKLITIGDSWTNGSYVDDLIKYRFKMSKDCPEFIRELRKCNGWPSRTSTLLNIPYVNLGSDGAGIHEYVSIIKKSENFFSEDDIIIIMLTTPYRRSNPDDIFKVVDMLEGRDFYLINSFYNWYDDLNTKDQEKINLSGRYLNYKKTATEILVEYEEKNNIGVWEFGFRNERILNSSIYKDNPDWFQSGAGAITAGHYHPNYLGYTIIGDWVYNSLKEHNNDI